MNPRWIVAGALLASAACMPPIRRMSAFSSRFPDNNREHVETVYARLPAQAPPARPTNALGVPLVVGVVQGEPRRVAAYDLAAGRQLWTADVNATSAPEILGDLVVVAAGNEIVGLDVRTGQRRWRVDSRSMPFMGAARDGDTVVLTLSLGNQGGATRVGRIIAVDARSGGERWSHQVIGILGRPAALSGYAFVPWDRQSVAVLDLATGVERARIRATDDVLSWVYAGPQGVYYGSRGAYRWTPRSASGTRTQSAYLPNPLEGVPGDPPLFRDAFAQTTGTRTARDKIRFAFLPRPGANGGMDLEHDTIYLAYYRYLVAVDARTGAVRWARAIGPDEDAAAEPASGEGSRGAQALMSTYDVESVTVTPSAVIVIGGDGKVRALDPATGAVLGTTTLGAPLGALATDLAGYRPPSTGAAPAPEGTVREQLVALIRDPDNRLVPIRAYLVRVLARRPEAEVTRELLELYRQRSIPNAMRQEISAALRARRNGEQYLVEALDGEEDHYNFLENRQAPPLDVIAPTLAAMGARGAVPVLLQHMLDHETPMAALPAVITAIGALGDASAVPPLQGFVQRYKSDSAFAGEANVPLQSAAAAIFRLGDSSTREWLTALAQDASAHAPLRQAITHLFEEERRGTEGQTQEQQLAHAREALQGHLNALRALVTGYPGNLAPEGFDAEWNNHLDELRECAVAAVARHPDLNEIRITVTLRSEPPAQMFQTTPPSARLPARPTFEQQMAAVRDQDRWVEQQIARVEGHRSRVRTTAYSPQDPELQRCMDAVIRPLLFPGFGRGITARTFQRQISTVRAQTQPTFTPGFGTPPGSSTPVPWFLVSSPSYDPQSGQLVAPTRASTSAGTQGTAGGQGTAGTSAGAPDAGGPPTPPGQGTGQGQGNTSGQPTRPWWEEQQ